MRKTSFLKPPPTLKPHTNTQGGPLPIEDGAPRGPEEPVIPTPFPPAEALPTEALCFFYPVSLTSLKCLRMVSWIWELFSYGIMSPHK